MKGKQRAGSLWEITLPRLPRIRTGGFPASGSSCCGPALNRFRRPHGDTLMRFDALAWFQTSSPQRGVPFSPRGPRGPVPPLQQYYGTLRLPTAHLAALRCLRLAIPPIASYVCPRRLMTRNRGHQGVICSGLPIRKIRWKRLGLSGSWEALMIIAHALRPRSDRSRAASRLSTRPTWSPHMSTTRTPYIFSFRGSITRPLTWLSTLRRASHPTPRKTRFWLPARLCQAGLATHGVSTKGFGVRGSSSFTKLS